MKNKKILVVDENPSMSELIAEILRCDGFISIEIALTHSSAISTLGQRTFDLVIAGLNRYETPSGIDVLKTAGTAKKILTSGDPESAENAILESRTDSFVPKPFPSNEHFLKVVKATLQD
ncbi:MAG: response regulator [bacterium]|nr:response regulator [bacterium]